MDFTEKKVFIPSLCGAVICLFFFRSGFLAFFFLVPLGFVAAKYNYSVAWTSFLFAAIGNAVLTIIPVFSRATPAIAALLDIVYFSAVTSIFVWIIIPHPILPALQGEAIRLFSGSCLGAIIMTLVFIHTISAPYFSDYMESLVNTLIKAYRSSGSDVVEAAMIDGYNASAILEMIKAIMLRGGSLVSCTILFCVSRQISLFIARLSSKLDKTSLDKTSQDRSNLSSVRTLTAFYVSPTIIWFFSSSLLLVVLTKVLRLHIPEIILWNILILCVIMYLAQGLGILQFFLTRPSMPPFLRLFFSVLLIVMFFSPLLNVILLASLLLLGIAENWAPLRAYKKDGPSSTPEAGE